LPRAVTAIAGGGCHRPARNAGRRPWAYPHRALQVAPRPDRLWRGIPCGKPARRVRARQARLTQRSLWPIPCCASPLLPSLVLDHRTIDKAQDWLFIEHGLGKPKHLAHSVVLLRNKPRPDRPTEGPDHDSFVSSCTYP